MGLLHGLGYDRAIRQGRLQNGVSGIRMLQKKDEVVIHGPVEQNGFTTLGPDLTDGGMGSPTALMADVRCCSISF